MHAIAKAIVFRETEKIVSEQPCYEGGGIRSRVVPDAIARLAHDAEKGGRFVDFERIWRTQQLDSNLANLLTIASEAVYSIIMGVASKIPNPLEWAKQQACWNRVQSLRIDWPDDWQDALLTGEDQKETKRSAVKDQRMLNGIEAQTIVVKAGRDFWISAKEWGSAKRVLTATEVGILDVRRVRAGAHSQRKAKPEGARISSQTARGRIPRRAGFELNQLR